MHKGATLEDQVIKAKAIIPKGGNIVLKALGNQLKKWGREEVIAGKGYKIKVPLFFMEETCIKIEESSTEYTLGIDILYGYRDLLICE